MLPQWPLSLKSQVFRVSVSESAVQPIFCLLLGDCFWCVDAKLASVSWLCLPVAFSRLCISNSNIYGSLVFCYCIRPTGGETHSEGQCQGLLEGTSFLPGLDVLCMHTLMLGYCIESLGHA